MMRQRSVMMIVVVFLAVMCIAISAFARRTSSNPVQPVTKNGIEYSVPHDRMGFVVATWLKTKWEIWSKQIYVVKYEYKFGLEKDVQWCFITNLELANGKLIVKNERGDEYELDLNSLEIKVLKGQSVIDYTNWQPPSN